MNRPFDSILYYGSHNSVTWQGVGFADDKELGDFMQNNVASRLIDSEVKIDFQKCLRGLRLTGLGADCLESVLMAEIPEDRGWAAAEALAEEYLKKEFGVIFPWNMERDKRNPRGSLPGADIIGFIPTELGMQLVLGEVKSSSEDAYPPQILSGRYGHLGHQIDNLAHNLGTILPLIKWLFIRIKGTSYERHYEECLSLYFNSGNKAIRLYGLLIRDTPPNERDLRHRGRVIGKSIQHPTFCDLIAIYLPFKISDLISRLNGGVMS